MESLQNIIEKKISSALNVIKLELKRLQEEKEREREDRKEEITKLKEENERLKIVISQHDTITKEHNDLKATYEQMQETNKQQSEEISSLKIIITNVENHSLKQEERVEDFIHDKLNKTCVISGPNVPAMMENEKTDQVLFNFLKNKFNITLQKRSIT